MPNNPKLNWSVYMIQCRRGTIYTGITTDVMRRFQEHQQQTSRCAKYLKGRHPLTLLGHLIVGSHQRALQLERDIKKWSKQKKLAWSQSV